MLKFFKKTLSIWLMCLLPLLYAATSVQASEITLAWNSVNGASGYKIYWGPADRTYTGVGIAEAGSTLRLNNVVSTLTVNTFVSSPMDVLNLTSFTFILEPGTYRFAVTAYNDFGESGYSDEVGTTIITITPGNTQNIHIITLNPSFLIFAYLNSNHLTSLN